jgi:hypothetical protein
MSKVNCHKKRIFVSHVEHDTLYIIHTNFQLVAHLSHLEGFVKKMLLITY